MYVIDVVYFCDLANEMVHRTHEHGTVYTTIDNTHQMLAAQYPVDLWRVRGLYGPHIAEVTPTADSSHVHNDTLVDLQE